MTGANDRATRGGRMAALGIVTLGLALLPACSNNDNTTLLNNDCGLVRSDLTGTWQVSFTTDSVSTVNCDAGSFNGRPIGVTSSAIDYDSVSITGSDASAAFLVTGDGTGLDTAVNPELIGSVQADSCLALFRIWDANDKAYIQCIGSFDIPSGTIAGSCDSADIDSPIGGSIEATCDLDSLLRVSVGIF